MFAVSTQRDHKYFVEQEYPQSVRGVAQSGRAHGSGP